MRSSKGRQILPPCPESSLSNRSGFLYWSHCESGDNAEETEVLQQTGAKTASQEISNKVEMVEVPNFSPHQATALMEDEGSPGREMSETVVMRKLWRLL